MAASRAVKQPRSSSTFWRFYMASWAALAGLAVLYLGTVTLGPDLADNPRMVDPIRTGSFVRDRDRLADEVTNLNKTIATLRSDLAKIKKSPAPKPVEATKPPSQSAPDPDPQAPAAVVSEPAPAPPIAVQPKPSSAIASASEALRNLETGSHATAPTGPAAETAAPVTTITSSETRPPEPAAARAEPEKVATTAESPPKAGEADRSPIKEEVAPDQTTPVGQPKLVNAPPAKPRGPNLAISPLRRGAQPPLPSLGPYIANAQTATTPPYSSVNVPPATRATNAVQTGSVSRARSTAEESVRKTAAPAPAPRRAARPIAFGAPKIIAASPPRPATQQTTSAQRAALALSTAPSITGLKASWLMLTTRHGSTLSRFSPRYQSDPLSGTFRLLAGPISSHAEADRICSELRVKNVACGVAEYTGKRL